MKARRGTDNIKNLTNGPGKLTKALGITMADYGHSFSKPLLGHCTWNNSRTDFSWASWNQ